MKITAIAATDQNGAIGYQNELLIRSKKDMENFKRETLGYPCIMGRKTFESLPKPLKDRQNIVISRTENYKPKGAKVFPSITAALQYLENEPLVFICGGGEIYAETLPLWTDLILTVFDCKFAKADTYFPKWFSENWHMESKEHFGSFIGCTIFHYIKSVTPCNH